MAPEASQDEAALGLAQFASFARLVPMMYVTLLANAWVMTVSFVGHAPWWMTWLPASALTLACVRRVVQWRRRGQNIPPADQAIRELRRTRLLAGFIPGVTCLWALALFPHGDDVMRSHVVFFLGYTIVTTMLCLVHVPGASMMVALFAGVPFLTFFALSGVPGLAGISLDVAVVTVAVLVAVRMQARDFAGLVTAREDANRREREQFRLLRMIDDLPVATVTVDPATLRIAYANRASHALAVRIADALPALRQTPLVGLDILTVHPDMARLVPRLRDPALLPHSARLTVGHEIVDLQVSAVTGTDGTYLGPMLSWAVVTQQVRAENRIRQMAHHDALTKLLNRYALHEALERQLAEPGGRTTVLMIDLDGFKNINDTLGHRVGDELLGEVADRLRRGCEGHVAAVARLGGDEFAVLLAGDDPAAAEATAMALVTAISAPYLLARHRQVRIGASIGIAFAPGHGVDGETLLSRADIALYAAKAGGKGTARVFSAEMYTRVHGRTRIAARLRTALETGVGLFAFFQPIVDVDTGRVTAREALIRWHHPDRHWISPAEFVPVAEEVGLIEEIGRFMLDQACEEAAGWVDDARVAVNVSAVQLGRGSLVPAVRAALGRSRLAADRLEIEVTETALLANGAEAIEELEQLRALGVRVALDDFGTGYSSLAHLRTFVFDKIKIDGSFVRDAVERPDCAAVVHAVAAVGRRLGVRTVAEGVETAEQLACARREGCHEAQGYLLGRPAPRERDLATVRALDAAPKLPPATVFADTVI